ncbi:hypothetical protein COO60DRAFT_1640819 [Scenedesmus sp. NREL 46B-D3]|nr:hypothetical protein COO60DRAFT_1640819 [Scenedesmus sp. NREL 46B-D3]
MLLEKQGYFALYNPALAAFDFKLLGVWLSQSTSNTRRRRLLVQHDKDQLVIGLQVSLGDGIIAKTAEKVVDVALNTPTAMSYFVAQGLEIARDKMVNESLLQQISMGVSDSTGRPLGASAGAAVLPGNANGSVVAVTCRKAGGGAFTTAATYEVLVTANFTCSDQRSLTIATTDVTVVPRPVLTVSLGEQPPPGCGGKPAVAIFRYTLTGLQPGQDFNLTAKVGSTCTAKLISRARKKSVSVLCCKTGSSYARVTGTNNSSEPTCFQHVKPGTPAQQCAQAVNVSGFFNQGPGPGRLMLAQKADECSDAIGVGSVRVSCPLGAAADKLNFRITTPAAHRSSIRRFLLSCSAPSSSGACPGKPRWVSFKAGPGQGMPEGLTTTVVNGTSTVEFNVTARCSCRSVYHGIVDFASYRGLPLSACNE